LWRWRVAKSGLSCFEPFLSLLSRWLDLIANYFIVSVSHRSPEWVNHP
jgi:hypothetical protein